MIACIRIPDFAVEIERRYDPGLRQQPIIIHKRMRGRDRVYAASPEAQAHEVQLDMTLSRATALCPDAQVIPAIDSRYQYTCDVLVEALRLFGDRIEVEKRTHGQALVLWLDVGRMAREETHDLGRHIVDHLQSEAGFVPAVGIASGKFPSRIAALLCDSGQVRSVAEEQTAAFLAPFPLHRLQLSKELQRRLTLLGIYTLGDLVCLPRSAVLTQFGKDLYRLHGFAQGEDKRPLIPYKIQQTKHLSRQFETPVGETVILNNVLRQMAGELAQQLKQDGYTTRTITLILQLEDGTRLEIPYKARQPVGEEKALTRILLRALKQVTFPSGVVTLDVLLGEVAPAMPRQLELFTCLLEKPTQPAEIVDDLTFRYDRDQFFTVVPVEPAPRLIERRFRFERVDIA